MDSLGSSMAAVIRWPWALLMLWVVKSILCRQCDNEKHIPAPNLSHNRKTGLRECQDPVGSRCVASTTLSRALPTNRRWHLHDLAAFCHLSSHNLVLSRHTSIHHRYAQSAVPTRIHTRSSAKQRDQRGTYVLRCCPVTMHIRRPLPSSDI